MAKSDERRADAARLKLLFERHQAQLDPKEKLTQEEFGERYGIGSQGMVWQYLNARTPLNLPAAARFAKGLGCKIEDFSPSLAADVMEALPHLKHKMVVAHDALDAQLLSHFQALSEEAHRDQIVGMAQRLFRKEHPNGAPIRLPTAQDQESARKARKRA